MFVHSVFFWMKPGVTLADRQQMISDSAEYLAKIPTVRHLFAGRPTKTSREVVDTTYDIAITTVLDDQAGYVIYQDHPLHIDFLKRNKQHWHRVKVYDFTTI
jgi:hypothetical protein